MNRLRLATVLTLTLATAVAVPAQTPSQRTQAPAPKGAPQQIDSAKRFEKTTGLARASTLVGAAVKDPAGKDAGKIEELMIDSHGRVAYAVVSLISR